MRTPRVSLKERHPEIAKQAFGWDPADYSYGSGKRMPWKCSVGHVWEQEIGERVSNKNTCPFCSGKRLLTGDNDLATVFPELASQAEGWNPAEVLPGSSRKVLWKCSFGHTWNALILERAIAKKGCPYCSNRFVFSGFNDLQTIRPDLAAEADGWDPSMVLSGTSKKLSWRCGDGHVWVAAASSRIASGAGCSVCANQSAMKGVNDLKYCFPDIASQAFGWDPETVVKGSHKILQWKCELGHTWKTSPHNRITSKGDCPICLGKTVEKGFNDLATTHPELASESHGWDPATLNAGSNKRVEWICALKHVWKAPVYSRTASIPTGCPYCAGQQVLKGFNDLQTLSPEIASEAHGWDPTTLTSGSNRKVPWVCELGHKYSSTISNRVARDRGCPFCSGHKVLKGFNDLATSNPSLALQADGWDPSTLNSGSNKRVRWRCDKGHKWFTSVNSRKGGETGCPSCAKSGYDPNSDGYLYFLEHESWDMYQIGITNFPKKRIDTHQKLGWNVVNIRGPMDGHLVQEWETAILRFLKKNGAEIGKQSVVGKFTGFTEAWTKASFNVPDLLTLMDMVDNFEQQ